MQIAKVRTFRTQAGWLCQAKEYANANSLALFVREVGRLQLNDLGAADEEGIFMVRGSLVEGVLSEPNRYLDDENDIRLTVWGGGEMFELVVMPDTEVRASFGTFEEGGQDLPSVLECPICGRSVLLGVPGLSVHTGCVPALEARFS